MLEEGSSAQLQELHTPAALRSSKVSHWFNNEIQKLKKKKNNNPKTKKNLSNGGLSVACFKCKPACLERLRRSSASMLKLQDWSICQRQKASLVRLPKQVELYLKPVKRSHPGSRRLFLFSLQTESIIENQFSASFGAKRAADGDSFPNSPAFWNGPEVAFHFDRCRTAGHQLLSSGGTCFPLYLQPASAETSFYNLYYFIW